MGWVKDLRGDRAWVWVVRVWWAALPFTAGPVLADGLRDTSAAWRSTASVGLWVLWAVVLLGALLAHPTTLVLVRLAVPSAVAALVWAGMGDADWNQVALVGAVTGAVAAIALSAPVGQVYVNGISYGDEIRLLLRPSAVLLAGPLPLAAAVTVAGVVSGPLLLAAQQWASGVAVTVAGAALAVFGARSLCSLTRRWLVFVPAGVVLHDHLAVQDPVLLRRRAVAGLGPAPRESDALDLSEGAAGLILEVSMSQPITLVPPARRKGKDRTEEAQASAILVAPSRPGQVVELARRRHLV
ncbi:hypothetical protein [Candidatus Poriferisocius sp.]|uniref:hypothetical protein n=1 Tax=Candidatus Poriferisocius sp. TaxID=3101276 RepID=UPI003B017D2C